MCSDLRYLCLVALCVVAVSCSQYRTIRKISSGDLSVGLSVCDELSSGKGRQEVDKIDVIHGTSEDGPVIMNAIRDSETGEMVATDIISASKVTAGFRNVAERAGYVTVKFDITVPLGMAGSKWQLKILPFMSIQDDREALEPVYITGAHYRAAQLRGYERYRAFLSSVITDTSDFIRVGQLEIFLERHFPETYRMKNDSSFISDADAGNLFGVTQKDALLHYTKDWKWKKNERRKAKAGKMFAKYVKDPIAENGIRLDTVLASGEGFTYRYSHTFRSRPLLKKVHVSLEGSIYEMGERILDLRFPEELTFYISSLSSLADGTEKYRMTVLERVVRDHTKALIDFGQGCSQVDTSLGDNAAELRRIQRCLEDVAARTELAPDSIVIVASCSPEGTFASNMALSAARSRAVAEYIADFVPSEWRELLKTSVLPENWEQFRKLLVNDTVISSDAKKLALELSGDLNDPDRAEFMISRMPEYRYFREKLYPKLRSVQFDFHLHRVGMEKDTVHTSEIDTVYMAGVQALRDLDYRTAVRLLRPYDDYNAALAFASAGYNHSALDVIGRLDDAEPKVCYLKALVLARLGQNDEAAKYLKSGIASDPHLVHRANLDPELSVMAGQIQNDFYGD